MEIKDYYKILELPPSATLKEIKTAYRRLAHQFHPDKSGNDLYAAAQFEIIKEAYEVLSNPAKKEYYLQQRWYNQSIGKKRTDTVITPVTILKQALELNKYVSTLDVHRMDEEGLFRYIMDMLSEETIRKINDFNEPDVGQSIVESVLKSAGPLSWKYAKPISERLNTIHAGTGAPHMISQYADRSRSLHSWEKYKAWLILTVVLLLCLIIYFVSH